MKKVRLLFVFALYAMTTIAKSVDTIQVNVSQVDTIKLSSVIKSINCEFSGKEYAFNTSDFLLKELCNHTRECNKLRNLSRIGGYKCSSFNENDFLYFHLAASDTIFNYDKINNIVKPRFIIDFKEYSYPDKLDHEDSGYYLKYLKSHSTKAGYVENLLISDSTVLFTYRMSEIPHLVLYDMGSRKTMNCVIEDDVFFHINTEYYAKILYRESGLSVPYSDIQKNMLDAVRLKYPELIDMTYQEMIMQSGTNLKYNLITFNVNFKRF